MDRQAFYDGRLFDVYQHMGVHQTEAGFCFVTFAPNAAKVALVGTFNNWQEEWMENQSGFYTYTSKTAQYGNLYKYRIYTSESESVEHTDPFAFQMELRPGCCAVISDINAYTFHDADWMAARSVCYDKPFNIYEMHMGSWKTNARDKNGWYRYDRLSELLIPYLLENQYTHVEFMPLIEHPFDGSWGYQTTGFFAPTSRYGEPTHLMALIDQLHQAGIGVIFDFVPVHFAVDSYGLRKYDGTSIYEYPESDVTESEWGTCNFIYARREVQCFMQSAANYWLTQYHVDGLRIDAVSRLIYWQGDESRGINPNSLNFLKQMNYGLKQLHPTAILIAEDSSTYPGVTKPVTEGGLGFDYKWALGWMHDTLEYFQAAPQYRQQAYHKLTFAMSYFSSERFLLEFSHDENVHGKATVLQKMHGAYAEKFPQGRALYLFMMVHPGKKLNFMGGEFGQLREWDETREQDWDILKYPNHDGFHQFIVALNHLYLKSPALYMDYDAENFRWFDCAQNPNCMYALGRLFESKGFLAVFNFSAQAHPAYSVTVPGVRNARLVLHTDWEIYGGNTSQSEKTWIFSTADTAFKLHVPAYSGMLFQIDLQKRACDEASAASNIQ